MDWVLKWWPILALVANGVTVWFVWSLRREFITRDDCGRCRQDREARAEKEGQKIGTDIQTIERRLSGGVLRTEMAGIADKIERILEKVGVLEGRLTGINRAVDLLNQHHLQGGK